MDRLQRIYGNQDPPIVRQLVPQSQEEPTATVCPHKDSKKAIMPDSSKSLHDRLKEGVVDFCERMADVEAGRRNQYVGISQQMHDAEDERRRLRKKAQEENEQARQKNLNDDAGGDEHHGEKDTYELGERWKPDKTTNDREAQKEKTAEDNLRKDKAVDKGAAHSIGKLQKQVRDCRKPILTVGRY